MFGDLNVHSSDVRDIVTVLRFNKAHNRETSAQYRRGDNWFGCHVVAVNAEWTEITVEIANLDMFVCKPDGVRISLAK